MRWGRVAVLLVLLAAGGRAGRVIFQGWAVGQPPPSAQQRLHDQRTARQLTSAADDRLARGAPHLVMIGQKYGDLQTGDRPGHRLADEVGAIRDTTLGSGPQWALVSHHPPVSINHINSDQRGTTPTGWRRDAARLVEALVSGSGGGVRSGLTFRQHGRRTIRLGQKYSELETDSGLTGGHSRTLGRPGEIVPPQQTISHLAGGVPVGHTSSGLSDAVLVAETLSDVRDVGLNEDAPDVGSLAAVPTQLAFSQPWLQTAGQAPPVAEEARPGASELGDRALLALWSAVFSAPPPVRRELTPDLQAAGSMLAAVVETADSVPATRLVVRTADAAPVTRLAVYRLCRPSQGLRAATTPQRSLLNLLLTQCAQRRTTGSSGVDWADGGVRDGVGEAELQLLVLPPGEEGMSLAPHGDHSISLVLDTDKPVKSQDQGRARAKGPVEDGRASIARIAEETQFPGNTINIPADGSTPADVSTARRRTTSSHTANYVIGALGDGESVKSSRQRPSALWQDAPQSEDQDTGGEDASQLQMLANTLKLAVSGRPASSEETSMLMRHGSRVGLESTGARRYPKQWRIASARRQRGVGLPLVMEYGSRVSMESNGVRRFATQWRPVSAL